MTDTPTPQMTPEQRARLIAKLQNQAEDIGIKHGRVEAAACMETEAAEYLEADGVTIATLTAERDALAAAQADLKAADAQIELLLKNHNGLTAEIARLTAALATAREDGMREARDAAYRYAQDCLDDGRFHAQAHCLEVATEIEAAIKEGAAT